MNFLMRRLQREGVMLDSAVTFRDERVVLNIADKIDDHVVIIMPGNTRPGPFWAVTVDDARRMLAHDSDMKLHPCTPLPEPGTSAEPVE